MILNTTQCNTYKILHVLNYFITYTIHCKKSCIKLIFRFICNVFYIHKVSINKFMHYPSITAPDTYTHAHLHSIRFYLL